MPRQGPQRPPWFFSWFQDANKKEGNNELCGRAKMSFRPVSRSLVVDGSFIEGGREKSCPIAGCPAKISSRTGMSGLAADSRQTTLAQTGIASLAAYAKSKRQGPGQGGRFAQDVPLSSPIWNPLWRARSWHCKIQ